MNIDVSLGLILGTIIVLLINSSFVAGVYMQRRWSTRIEIERKLFERLLVTVDRLSMCIDGKPAQISEL